MISNISSDYQSICELFNFRKESTADINKKILLEMANNGEYKPIYGSKLGNALQYYTLECSRCFDPTFTKEIKKIRPDWFISITCKFKEKLIEIAKNKKSKQPKTTSKLGLAFRGYTKKNSKTYDPIFTKKIRSIRPDWLINQTNNKKQILLKMAKNNKNKPNWNTTLRRCLRNYTTPKNGCFDPIFTKKIKKIRPDWFINSIDKNKIELLKLAKIKKSNRPKHDTKLGRAIRRYQYCSYYKSDKSTIKFIKQIKKLKPNWFLK